MIKHKLKDVTNLLIGIAFLVFLVVFSYSKVFKWDLTEDKRFTLTDSTYELLDQIDDVVEFKVYLDGEYLPADLTRVKGAIAETLEELADVSGGLIEYQFIDLYNEIEKKEDRNKELVRLSKKGLTNMPIPKPNLAGKVDKIFIPLGAEAFYNGRSISVPFIRGIRGRLNQKTDTYEKAIEEMEFELTNAIRKLKQDTMKTIGFLQGHGELGRFDIQDYTVGLYEYYNTGPIYLTDTNGAVSPKSLKGLNLLVIAKPTRPFSQKEQYVIDQYIMNGGKIIWMVEGTTGAELDSMQTQGLIFPTPLETGLDAMLFKYGIRINKDIVEDLQCSKIPIQSTTNGSANGFKLYNWVYNPVLKSENNHLINKNLDPVKLEFSSSIDTIPANGTKFTALLQTSGYNRYKKTPCRIGFRETASGGITPEKFTDSAKAVAVLVEGSLDSYFKNRITPAFANNPKIDFKDRSAQTEMIVISDGDIAKNWFTPKGDVIPMGQDQYTKFQFDNKKFLINCANYLLGDKDMIEARSKNIKLRLLNKKLVEEDKEFMQLINVGGPVLFIILLSVGFILFRKFKFAK